MLLLFFSVYTLIFIAGCDNSSVEQGKKDSVGTKQGEEAEAVEKEGSRARAEELIRRSGERNQLHIAAGNLAVDQAEHQAVKEFAHRMVKDHSIANEELRKLAAKRNVNLSDSLTGRRKQMVEDLKAVRGNAFDKQYMKLTVETHKEDIQKFSDFLKDIKDPAVIEWGQGMLQQMEQHMEMARQVQKTIKSSSKNA